MELHAPISGKPRSGFLSWLKSHANPDLWALCTRIHRLVSNFPALFKEVQKAGVPDIILHFGIAVGDDLLCTIVARELKKRGVKRIWMCTKHPQLFMGNTDVSHLVTYGPWISALKEWFPRLVPDLSYSDYDISSDRGTSPAEHISVIQCRKAGIRGPIELRPHIFLSSEEQIKQQWASGWIAIQSSGLDAAFPMQNKQWLPERFQAVASRLSASYQLVQLGGVGDPPLSNAMDLRGRTSLRESAAILSQCRLYIGTVGMLMHLARAVDCPSVIIYGGRERPDQSGYSCNVNLTTSEPCSPCWRQNNCDYERACMQHISVDMVLQEVFDCLTKQTSIHNSPLAIDLNRSM